MKTIKKIALMLLSAVFALSAFSCADNGRKTVVKDDNVIHYVEGTLHKVNVSKSDVPFAVNGETNYTVYADLSNPKLQSAVMRSVNFIREQVFNATGANMPYSTEKPVNLSENDYAIVYGFNDLYTGMGLSVPTDEIGSTGYYIKTKGNVVFIQANGSDGYRMGGLAFLREVLGYDMITEDCVVYSKDGKTMPKMDIVERPDFDYRQIQNYTTSIEVYGTGMHKHTDIWIPVGGWDMHNTLYYIPVEKYAKDHPDWYRADRLQACYTAHGNQKEYDLLVETVFEVVKTRMQECPTLENISFTAMDGTGEDSCTCETCSEYKNLYGTPAATCIYFMNDLNRLVQEHINENEPGRVMNLTFFAYHDAEPAPVEREKRVENGNVIWGEPLTDENGQYMRLKRYARDENGAFIKDESGNYVYERDAEGNYVYLECDEHVYPWLAPIYSKFTHSFYDEINKSYAQNVSLWYTVSDNVYVWIYGTNFSYYLYPYNTWSVVPETYRYMRESGVKYIWTQAQERNQSTAFTDLKDYIDAKFQFDVNADYDKVINSYFNNYYLEAAPQMKKLFDIIQMQSAYLEESVPTITGGIYDDIGEPDAWPLHLIEEMLRIIDQAYASVAKYKSTDPALYKSLINRIKKESIFPRYVLCTHFTNYPNITQLRREFRDDWNALGFSIFKETNGDMQSVFISWRL